MEVASCPGSLHDFGAVTPLPWPHFPHLFNGGKQNQAHIELLLCVAYVLKPIVQMNQLRHREVS